MAGESSRWCSRRVAPELAELVLHGPGERPEVEVADRLDAFDEHLEAVAPVEGEGAFGERLQVDRLADCIGSPEAVPEQRPAQPASVSGRVDGEEPEVPVRLEEDSCDRGSDRREHGVELAKRHGRRETVEAGPCESLRFLARITRELPRGDRLEVGETLDVAEEPVVADKRTEQLRRQARTQCRARKEAACERVIVEGPRDQGASALALGALERNDLGDGVGQRSTAARAASLDRNPPARVRRRLELDR